MGSRSKLTRGGGQGSDQPMWAGEGGVGVAGRECAGKARADLHRIAVGIEGNLGTIEKREGSVGERIGELGKLD